MPKNILIISPVPTHPATSGNNTRVAALTKSIRSLGHNVYFMYINYINGDISKMREDWGNHFIYVPYTRPIKKYYRRIRKIKKFLSIKSAYTYLIDEWYDSNIDQYILDLTKKIKFDVVIVEYVFFSKALCNFSNDTLKLIDTHDVFTDRHKLHLKQGVKPSWFSTTAKEEKKGLRRADIIIAIQHQEVKFYENLVENIKVIELGHITPLVSTNYDAVVPNSILIIASQNEINLHSTNLFMKEIFPEIKKYVPNAQVLLAGKLCGIIENHDGLKKMGEVDDLGKLYASAAVVVNPITFGTGLKIKSIEALGYAKPLVTTSIGAEGLESGKDSAFLVAESPKEFSEMVVTILTNKEISKKLSSEAYRYAREWNHNCLNKFEKLFN